MFVFQNRGSEEKDTSNYDREPLFLLEGMDDGPLIRNSQGSDHESDTDGNYPVILMQ